jgi:two-component system, cell cycle sensor histidine kinase and response regulator CckA
MIPAARPRLHLRGVCDTFTTNTMASDDISVTQWRDAETLRMALEAAGMGLWSWDAISDAVIWDDQTCRVFGREPGSGPANYSEYLAVLHPEDRLAVRDSVTGALRTGVYRDIEHRILRPDGTVRWILGKGALLRSPDGTLLKIIGGVVDITEQVEAERAEAQKATRLMHAHQMEMVGRLAGGLAHDFNNFLTVINGYSELLLSELSVADPHRNTLELIRRAGESAAVLTGQLLAYGRVQVLQPMVLDLNRTLTTLLPLLARLTGENIQVQLELHPEAAAVHADPVQMEQVIMNLVLNARDAMPFGGALRIGTACVEQKTSDIPSRHDSCTNRAIMLWVIDNGMGMDQEAQQRIFEPFFTTKEFGKGTGLGMSIVQGIIAQSGGSIEVHSQPGNGTTFRICLPQALGIVAPGATMPETRHGSGDKGNVMVVEDHAEVGAFAATVLTNYGYRVFKADNAVEALLFFQQEHERIDLVLTDVIMPGMSGPEMGARLKCLHPEIEVLYMSGYTADKIADHGVLDPETHFIPKPFTPGQLAGKVLEILERGSSAPSVRAEGA